MFFVVNKTKQTVILSDIGVTLGPRQAMDLDRLVDRYKSDKSKHLKMANRKGQVEIRIKDGEKPKNAPAETSSSDNTLENFKKEIIEEIKGTMKELSPRQVEVKQNDIDLDLLAQKIAQKMPTQKETVIIQEGKKQERTDEEVEIDSEVLADINARAVDNIVEGTDINAVNYKEEQQEDTILNNVDELENLLGE